MAEAILKNENLGQGTETDMLTVSISPTDAIGHKFSTRGPENHDATFNLTAILPVSSRRWMPKWGAETISFSSQLTMVALTILTLCAVIRCPPVALNAGMW